MLLVGFYYWYGNNPQKDKYYLADELSYNSMRVKIDRFAKILECLLISTQACNH